MLWKPIRGAHAIDRVRLLVSFHSPLPDKILDQSTNDILKKSDEFGFSGKQRVGSNAQYLPINHTEKGPQLSGGPVFNGWVMQRLNSDASLLEEVGFRDTIFGYVTTSYTRWQNLVDRLDEVFFPALDLVAPIVRIASVKLEYWDLFYHDATLGAPDCTRLLDPVPQNVPELALKGEGPWHVNTGWFETLQDNRVLLNKNIECFDLQQQDPIGENSTENVAKRHIIINTSADFRFDDDANTPVRDLIGPLHQRVSDLFAHSISNEARQAIGLAQEAVQ